jgi:ribosomal protein S18 acetylase RimI-like enzyme
MGSSIPATVAGPTVRDRAVDTVVRAFVADPAFRYFFPDDATYADDATAFAGWLFDRRVRFGTVWVAAHGAAVAMWESPRPPAAGAEGPEPQLTLGGDGRQRLDRYEHAVSALLPAQPYWYLGVLATAPQHSGRGLGRAVMRAGLERASADGVPSVLETTNPDNLPLYEHLGWTARASTLVDGMTIWVLTHPPG